MRNRKVQRELRRVVGKQDELDKKNYYGLSDPTPYKAVKNLIRRGELISVSRIGEAGGTA